MIGPSFVLLSLLFSSATTTYALNDWSKPCLQGSCEYDLPADDDGTTLGSMKIWGSPDAISDITPAAGWTIIGCSPDALAQDIRLVCTSDEDGAAAGCEHLFQGGAENTIVRLPENCGQNAFARVARAWIPEDQSIPTEIARRLVRRQAAAPQVQALALDTDFAAATPANGDVNIQIEGANIAGQNGDGAITAATAPTAPQRRSRLQNRGGFIQFIEDAFNKFNNLDESITTTLPPIDIDKNFPIFESKVSCPAKGLVPAFDASLNVAAQTKANAQIHLGVAAAGTLIPPKLEDFGLFVGMDGDFNANIKVSASAAGTADSGKVTLAQVGIPGLNFPGILTVGPSFKLVGQAKASLDIEVDTTVNVAYNVKDAKLFFPKSNALNSGGEFTPAQSALTLSVAPSVASKGTIEAHIIPRIDVGIDALAGAAKATVFMDLDASAALKLSLEASANANVKVTPTTPAATAASGQVGGCVDIGGALDINAGADASFFGLFDQTTKVPVVGKKFELFKKCFKQTAAAAPVAASNATASSAAASTSAAPAAASSSAASSAVAPVAATPSAKPSAKPALPNPLNAAPVAARPAAPAAAKPAAPAAAKPAAPAAAKPAAKPALPNPLNAAPVAARPAARPAAAAAKPATAKREVGVDAKREAAKRSLLMSRALGCSASGKVKSLVPTINETVTPKAVA